MMIHPLNIKKLLISLMITLMMLQKIFKKNLK